MSSKDVVTEMQNLDADKIREEARKCIEIHSYLFTCMYNWAAAHTFYEQEVICWSTTAAYYAMMHSVRTLFSLIHFCPELDELLQGRRPQTRRTRLKTIIHNHTLLCNFLQNSSLGNNDKIVRQTCVDCFRGLFPGKYWDSFLVELGKKLAIHKKAREFESYEHFVVAHHARGHHIEYPFIKTVFEKSEEGANEFIPEVLESILDLYRRDFPFKDYHLWHLRDEIKWLEATMNTEALKPPREMTEFLGALRKLVKSITMPTNYFRFEEEMDARFYTRKADVYRDLENIANELITAKTNETL